MSSELVYSTESDGTNSRGPLASNLCKHGKDAGQTCNPCDVGDYEWLDRHYTGGPGENLDFREVSENEGTYFGIPM